jgi:CheY-like chemotaxis protein
MEPDADVPANASPWRTYEILLYRYVQQSGQLQVADQIGLSTRQLRREEARAVEELARELVRRFGLLADRGAPQNGGSEVEGPSEAERDTAADELAWLEEVAPLELVEVEVRDVLCAVRDLVRPLAAHYQVRIEEPLSDAPPLAIHPLALRQAMVSLVTMAIHHSAGHMVRITARKGNGRVQIDIVGGGAEAREVKGGEDSDCVTIVQRLVAPWGGRLELQASREAFRATLDLPIPASIPVLLIDDNRDTWQLFQRYVSGTRYALVATDNIADALTLAAEVKPQIIVLDVMMPPLDGWELLGRLRQHPTTSQLPIVVCTILAHEELARMLGASAFLHKPITREAFQAALDSQVDPEAPRALQAPERSPGTR